MLCAIADLYLTAKVLILLDTMYRTRLWTTMVGWCTNAEGDIAGHAPGIGRGAAHSLVHPRERVRARGAHAARRVKFKIMIKND